jgi:uncharacterized membrane protein
VTVLTAIACVGSALVGGVWFAFSGFVMQALARVPAAHGAAAMQAINVTADRWTAWNTVRGVTAVAAAVAFAVALAS